MVVLSKEAVRVRFRIRDGLGPGKGFALWWRFSCHSEQKMENKVRFGFDWRNHFHT